MAIDKPYIVIGALGSVVIALILVFVLLPPAATKYVCPDGKTVADSALCATGTAGAGTTGTSVETAFESELEVCTGMPSTQTISFEDVCIIGLAGKHKDTSLCTRVVRDQRLTCYALVAEVKDDPEVCSEAEFQEDQCYEQYARDKREGSACSKIKTVSTKDSCYYSMASQLGDPTFCDSITYSEQKDRCYLDMAQRTRDSSYCNKITNSNQKQNCLQNMQGMQGSGPISVEVPKHP